ncbi:MAG: AAA family ATPase [Burkholderiales bacterium]|nr:AAA family ATPase [Burkholderiales bacterium]
MLNNLTVAGFKSIKKQSIDLGRVNVFIGPNGAGKSNILEAIGFLSAAISGGITYSLLGVKGVRSSAPSVYRSALKGSKRPKYFDLSAEFDGWRYHCNIFSNDDSLSGSWNFHSESFARSNEKGAWANPFAGRSGNGVRIDGVSYSKSILESNQSIVRALEVLGALHDNEEKDLHNLAQYAIYSPFTSVLRGLAPDPSFAAPLGLYGGNLPSAVKDVFNQKNFANLTHFFNLFPWVRTLGLSKGDPKIMDRQMVPSSSVLTFTDNFMIKDFNNLYSSDVSEGALYCAFILALMLHNESPNILALDNVDSTLNPGLVRQLVKTISLLVKDSDKQVLMTTHNPTALDALDLFDNEHKLYVVDRNGETGETEVNLLRPPESMTQEEWDKKTGGAKLSELWLNGFLGGMPLIENF